MKLSALISLVILAIATTGLVITNPGPEDYASYIREQAETYLADEICTDLPPALGESLMGQCADMVASLGPQLDTLIRDRTERLNLAVVSLYRTSLGIPGFPMLPSYQVETLGVLRRFITYRVAEQR